MCKNAIENFLQQIGVKTEAKSTFNPYEAGFSSMTGINTYVKAEVVNKKSVPDSAYNKMV